MTSWLLACALAATPPGAGPTRLLLSAGNDVGLLTDEPLRHAERDAARVRDVFVELGGVAPEDATVLGGQPAARLEQAVADLGRRVRALEGAGRPVTLLVYVSAHARDGELHLAGTTLGLSSLRQALSATGASLTLLVVDACSSGQVLRTKGASRAATTTTLELPKPRGLVVLSSSGPAEAAQEWDSLGGSLFTHHWLAGLRGQADEDADGRVTLFEAYRYAQRRTVAEALHGGQHPAYDFDVTGAADWVLTTPAGGAAAVELAAALQGRYVLVGEPAGSLVLELEKRPGRALRIAVPPGRYRLKKQEGPNSQLAVVELPWGGARRVEPQDFTALSSAQVALKGPRARPLSLSPSLAARSRGVAVRAPTPAFGATVGYAGGGWWLAVSGAVSAASEVHDVGRVDEVDGELALEAGLDVEVGPLRLLFGLTAGPLVVTQALRRQDAERLARLLGPSEPARRLGLGGVAGPRVALELSLVGPTYVTLTARLLLRALPAEGAWSLAVLGELGGGVGLRF